MSLPPENAYGHTKKLRFIIDALERQRARVGRPLRVLDFGCGNGAAVTRFLGSPEVEVHGVDIHRPSLEYAKHNFASDRMFFHSEVPQDICFDAVVYADVLEHLDDPAQVIASHVAQLDERGIVVGAIPNGRGPFEIEHKIEGVIRLQRLIHHVGMWRRRWLRRARASEPAELPYNHDSGHLVFFSRKSLRHTLSAAGLRLARFAHGSLFCGPYSTPLIRGPLVGVNVTAADSMPSWAVSVWYFEAHHAKCKPT